MYPLLGAARPDVGAPGSPGAPVYYPALDGLRAVAVLAVVAFHQGYGWAQGGFLGVSLFFTLSGFLITTLLLREYETYGTIRLDQFFARRVRRLLPPALLTVVGVWAAAVLGLWDPAGLRGDLIAATLYVANWRFLADGASYQRLFDEPSPVLHFWSLAIEEQFYFLVAPTLLLALKWRKGRSLLPGVAVLALGSLAVTFAARGNPDFVYYSSLTRAFELLAGVALAIAVVRAQDRRRARREAVARRAAFPVLVVLLVAMVMIDRRADWLYSGALALFAVGSAVVVLGCVAGGSTLSRLLSLRPLVTLGRLSYAVYLFHWPVFLALTPARTGLAETPLFTTRMAVSLGLAVLSSLALERPIRFRWRATERAVVAWGSLATTAVAVVVGANLIAVPSVGTDLAPVNIEASTLSSASGRGPRLAVFGDSTALRTAIGLREWAGRTGAATLVPGSAQLGCGLVAEGEYQFRDEPTYAVPDRCDWRNRWAAAVDDSQPEVGIVQVGLWEVTNHRLPGDEWRHIGDPVYDDYLRREIEAAVDLFAARAVTVVWLTTPRLDVGPYPTSEPRRVDRLNRLVAETLEGRPGVTVVDLAARLALEPGGELDRRLRPDGVHFTERAAVEVAEWLGPDILAARER